MWEMYLASSETGFRYQNLMVFQIQLAKSLNALPITRDYMFDRERELNVRKGEPSRSRTQRSAH